MGGGGEAEEVLNGLGGDEMRSVDGMEWDGMAWIGLDWIGLIWFSLDRGERDGILGPSRVFCCTTAISKAPFKIKYSHEKRS